MSKKPYKVLQDESCNWYWIPNDMVKNFHKDCKFLEGKMYMDCPAQYDVFDFVYSDYRTGGSPDCVPNAFEGKDDE